MREDGRLSKRCSSSRERAQLRAGLLERAERQERLARGLNQRGMPIDERAADRRMLRADVGLLDEGNQRPQIANRSNQIIQNPARLVLRREALGDVPDDSLGVGNGAERGAQTVEEGRVDDMPALRVVLAI